MSQYWDGYKQLHFSRCGRGGIKRYGEPIREELLDIIKDRESVARKEFEKNACECGCPLSGIIVGILFQRIALELQLPKNAIKWGLHAWTAITKSSSCIQGRDRTHIAAALAYLASCHADNYRTQLNIAKVVGTTDMTMRMNIKTLLQLMRDLGIAK